MDVPSRSKSPLTNIWKGHASQKYQTMNSPQEEQNGDDAKHANRIHEAANMVKELTHKATRPPDNLGKPLLSTSQHSFRDIGLASSATAVEPSEIHLEPNMASFSVGPQAYNTSNPFEPNFQAAHHQPSSDQATSHSLGVAYSGLQASADGCYSQNEVVASNGDLSGSNLHDQQSRVHRRVDRPRYEHKRSSVGSTLSRGSSIRGSTITFRKIRYEVDQKKWPWSKPTKKIVLNDVSGMMGPGLNAIMGPTGCGKSSLLDVLAARKDPRFLRGEVIVDGAAQPSNFKCISGYVVQDDIVMGTLTVRENLRFSAALRLPSSRSDEERNQKVEEIIEELSLTKVANSKIGTELIRGVSGGERKRTNIGIELITDPPVLFLDEPTTGLDAFTANSVIKTLRKLANKGRTVIFSIHQPKYSIYKLFETLTLVINGKIAYHGRAEDQPLLYFQKIGYICEAHNNPADFFMDIIHGEVSSRHSSRANLEDLDGVEPAMELDTDRQTTAKDKISQLLIDKWSTSPLALDVEERVESIYQESIITSSGSHDVKMKQSDRVQYPTSYFNQLNWVSWRTALNLIRNPQSSVIQLAVYLFFALSVGSVYVNLDMSTETGVQNRQGLFFFIILQMVFVNLGAIEVFIKERVQFIHENSSGFYRVSVYFLAKVFCDMLPIKTLPVILFMPIVYFMAGLRLDVGAFFTYELSLILATCAACGVAFFVSASVSIFGIANIIISIMYVFMMIFGGYLKSLRSIGPVLNWCRYLSVFNYAFSALSITEFKGQLFCPLLNTTNVTVCTRGETILINQSINYANAWDLWSNQLGLFMITIFFCVLCYIQLCRINKYK